VIERVAPVMPEVFLLNRSVDEPGKEMKDGPFTHVIAHGRMSVFQQLPCESMGTLPSLDPDKSVEVAQGEVPGVPRYHIKEAGLGFRVAEGGDSFDLVLGQFHSDKISALNSCRSRILRSFEISSGWA
jgi:hypothetical protein